MALTIDNDKLAHLMMLCGALHDIAEKSKDEITKGQLFIVEQQIEKILGFEDPFFRTLK